MNLRQIAFSLALVASSVAPAFAQQAPAGGQPGNATVEGTEGPNANGSGYPSATSQAGVVARTNVGPSQQPGAPVAAQ